MVDHAVSMTSSGYFTPLPTSLACTEHRVYGASRVRSIACTDHAKPRAHHASSTPPFCQHRRRRRPFQISITDYVHSSIRLLARRPGRVFALLCVRSELDLRSCDNEGLDIVTSVAESSRDPIVLAFEVRHFASLLLAGRRRVPALLCVRSRSSLRFA